MKRTKKNDIEQNTPAITEPAETETISDVDVLDDEAILDDISEAALNDDNNFPDIEITDPDLLPDPAIIANAEKSSDKHYETLDVDVNSSEGMLALRSAFKPKYYASESASDPLTLYLSHIRNHPILDAENQQKLAIRYKQQNDLEAAQLLVLTNLRLVVKIAREYKRRWANLLELIQEGNVGLSEAIQRYDPYRHVKFTSYAQYWIRAMILNYLMNHFQPIRIGSTRAGRKLFYNLRKARNQLQQEGHTNPTPALVAEKLGVSEQDVIDVSRQLDAPALSIDQTAPGYENVTIGELLKDGNATPEQEVANEEFYSKVHDIMVKFGASITDPREQALWNRRLMSDDPITLAELGAEYHISKERIRQIEARLKDRFKEYIMQRIDGDIATFIDV
ncbi:MAG: sigma-70 family RNA polymerase sigma factor [Proteobacteria bacterium]|nr:sigma-70 family RNA polymerase sigma factor [Pseudomonadota bacterium]